MKIFSINIIKKRSRYWWWKSHPSVLEFQAKDQSNHSKNDFEWIGKI